MGLFVLLAALAETINETVKEKIEYIRAGKERREYENIDFNNIDYVTFDGTEPAYRIETEEEYDPVNTFALSQMNGAPCYATKTVEYEVPDGENYLFTIRYNDGSEIYRKFHEDSPLTERLLEYYDNQDNELEDILEEVNDVVSDISNMFNFDLEDSETPQERFAVIDFETTGLNYDFRRPPMDEIISVAIIDQDENVLLNTYCNTVKIKSWYEAQRIHGISPADVKGYPTFVEIMPQVIEILSSYDYVISYNVPFEKFFLENYAHLYTPTDFSIHKINWGEDPMEMFRDYVGSKRYKKLEEAADHFGYNFNAHNALEDTKATLYIYNAIRGKDNKQYNPPVSSNEYWKVPLMCPHCKAKIPQESVYCCFCGKQI